MGLFNNLFGKKLPVETPLDKVQDTVSSAKEVIKTDIQKEVNMSNKVKFIIDGKECTAEKGMMLVDAAAENGVYIPVLCHMKGMIPAGSCRVCTCKINGRNMAGCTTPVDEGMKIENDTPELTELRKTIVEVLFVEGNHFCPACEKSGNCELQALGYKYQMMVPRFPYSFPPKAVEAGAGKIYLDRNRCIMCKKCIRTVHVDGKNVFAFRGRGAHLEINIDKTLAAKLTDKQAQEAMDVCPVGSILRKEKGFDEPIGTRKYDKHQIGSEIEKVS